jgi:glycosyltransferase involved in cell wall biosynthesis
MRILMLNNEFPPLGGGTGVVNYHLLKQFSRYHDVWVDVVTSSGNLNTYAVEQFAPRIVVYKLPIHADNIHHATNCELMTYAWRAWRWSRKLLKKQRYDLSFAFAGVPAGAISYMLKLSSKLPYLISLQGPDVPGFEERYNYLYPILKPLIRRIWKSAGKVTAISDEHRRLANQTMPALCIPIIHNGVDIKNFEPAKKQRLDKRVNILCVGRLIARKGQHHLLRAFANLLVHHGQRAKLTLVGVGDAEEQLRSLATDLQLTDAIEFAGFVPREKIPEIYAQADIFVLPSQNEGMSIALLEAMASGLPVIVTDTGGTTELVEEKKNGLIIPWADISSLTEAMTIMVQNTELRTQMGQESRKIVTQFSWPTVAQSYLDLCAQISRSHSPSPTVIEFQDSRVIM